MKILSTVLTTLGEHPVIGASGSLGGFYGSLIAVTPLLQFIAAAFGAVIGGVTIVGMICKTLGLNCKSGKKRKGNK